MLRRDRAMTAVAVMLDVTLHAGRTEPCSAADIAKRLGVARRGIEPVLQSLTRSGLLEGVRGPAGGYRLGRPRRDIRLSEVVQAVRDCDNEDGPPGALQAAVIEPLWKELDSVLTRHLGTLTVADLLQRAAAHGINPRPAEPLDFAI